MKSLYLKSYTLLLALVAVFTLVSCSDDDPEAIVEEEIITSIEITLTPGELPGAQTITLESRDLDGDGPNAPVVEVSGPLAANTVYTGSIRLLNELESPVEDMTIEIEELDEEHQLFYVLSGANATVAYTDSDSDGNPVGLAFTLTTGAASSGTLTVILRHEPKKPNTGAADAGGDTDIEQSFSIVIQ